MKNLALIISIEHLNIKHFQSLGAIYQRTVMLLIFTCNLIACSNPVMFNGLESGDVSRNRIYKVYFDREGYVYPDPVIDDSVIIEVDDFSSGSGKGYLKRYFCTHEDKLKKFATQKNILGAKYKEYDCQLKKEYIPELDEGNDYNLYDYAREGYSNAIDHNKYKQWIDQWDNIQEFILTHHSDQLADLLEKNNDHALFVMIHGYNNGVLEISDNYNGVREYLEKHYKTKKFVFLDIYWDGFKASIPFAIWAKAQYTGPLVGVKLRKILNEVKQDTPVRILTHSSGAFVVGNMIGDGRKGIPNGMNRDLCNKSYNHEYCNYQNLSVVTSDSKTAYKQDYAVVKSTDLKVGMIAPATSSWLFIGGECDEKPCAGLYKPSGTLRIIIGQHNDDYANTKVMFSECDFGVTSLGVNKSSFCEIKDYVSDNGKLEDYIDVYRVNFKSVDNERVPWFGFWADHALSAYLNRDKATSFFSLLLNTKISIDINEDNNCKYDYHHACEAPVTNSSYITGKDLDGK